MNANYLKKNLPAFIILLLSILVSTVNGGSCMGDGVASYALTSIVDCYYGQDMIVGVSKNIYLDRGKMCYGYQAYPNPDLLVCFEIDDPGTLYTIGSPISLDKISGGTWVDGVWWCCEYTPISNSNIWNIDYITGDMTLIGASGSTESLHGLAYDDVSGTMYACGAENLFTIDMVTGAATLVGPFGISNGLMIGIACDGYNNIYGEDLHTDSLYSIDFLTGAATLIGPFGLDLNHGQDMEIDKEEGICYLSAFTVHAGDEGALYSCNLTTGAVTKIGNFGTGPTQITGFAIPYSLNNPPYVPAINGRIRGKVGEEYNYIFLLSDPDNDSIYLRVNWGNGTSGPWKGPYNSYTTVMLNHTWNQKGTFTIKAQVKDTYDIESEWGTLDVTMLKNQHLPSSQQFLLQLLQMIPRFF